MGKAEKACDVLVIGAGIVGCFTAHTLVSRGHSVILIDADAVGSGTSSSSFSWINATSKSGDPEYFRLNAQGLNRYLDLAGEWGKDIGLHQTGMIEWVSPHDLARRDVLRHTAQRLNDWDYGAEWLGRSQLEQLEPSLYFEQGAEGLFTSRDCWLDIPRLLQILVREIQQAGSEIIEYCSAEELIASDSGEVQGVRTERHRIVCSSVVVATGARTPDVLSHLTGYDGFRTRFPVRCAPGLLITTPPTKTRTVRHILYSSHDSGLHVRPAGQGRLLVGADDTDGMISESDSEEAVIGAGRLLLTRLAQLIPDFPGSDLFDQCRVHIGVRAVPEDGRSIAGPALSADGLYIIVTHSGITLAPVLSELIADCIETGDVPEQLAPYSLDRFDP